jgi:ABC-type Fe3+ transport system permease subunit
MRLRLPLPIEHLAAIASVAVGAAVSGFIAPKDSWFLPNLLFYWVPQLFVLAFFCLKPPRPAVFTGIALALSIYLALFAAWLLSRQRPESMAWLGYLFSLPGAVIGALVAIAWLDRKNELRAVNIGAVVGTATLLGIAVNQAVVCSTVLYCMGK